MNESSNETTLEMVMNGIRGLQERSLAIQEAVRRNSDDIRILQMAREGRSPASQTENVFTPIREMTRGESLLNVTENFGTPELPKLSDPPKSPLNSRASFSDQKDAPPTPVFQSAPRSDHIKPKDLSAMEIYQFIQQVRQYENQHKIRLSLAWCLSDVQAKMVAQSASLRLEDFRNLSNHDCEQRLRNHVRPKSIGEFIKVLDTVHFCIPANMRTTSVTFKDIYEAFIVFSESFRNLYDFLDSNQDKKLMPNVDKKPKGVIFIYLKKLPEHMAELYYTHMMQDHWLENYEKTRAGPFKNNVVESDNKKDSENKKKFRFFIERFEKEAKAHMETYDRYKPIEDIMVNFPSDYETLKSKRQVLNKLMEVPDEVDSSELCKMNEPLQPAQKSVQFAPRTPVIMSAMLLS